MQPLRSLLLWCLATLLSTTWAAEPLAGPWVVVHPDGSYVVALEMPMAGKRQEVTEVILTAVDGSDERVAVLTKVERSFAQTTLIASMRVEPDAPRKWRLDWGQMREVTIDLPKVRMSTKPACVVISTPSAYPTRSDIQKLATELGAQPELMVLLGDGGERYIGRGGWEATVPIAVVPTSDAPRDILDIVAGPGAAWVNGVHWGRLGMPSVQGKTLARAGDHLGLTMARDLSPWLVALDPHGWWRMDRPSAEHGAPVELIEMARQRAVPLVVSATPSAGFLSDPLSITTDGSVVEIPGGTRWLGLTDGATDVAGLPAHIAHFHPEPAILGLLAEEDLTVVEVRRGGDVQWNITFPPWPVQAIPQLPVRNPGRLLPAMTDWMNSDDKPGKHASQLMIEHMARWRQEGRSLRGLRSQLLSDSAFAIEIDSWLQQRYPWPAGGLHDGRGWGVGNVEQLSAAWQNLADGVAAEQLSWLSREQLERAMRQGVTIEAAMIRYRDSGGDPRLLYRMGLIEPNTVFGWLASELELPAELARDVFLRQMDIGLRDLNHEILVNTLHVVDDPLIIRAILTRAEADPDPILLKILVRHWQQIHTGDEALPADPVLQHRLATAVFDSPFLSPTPLRPLAVGLQDKVHAAARGPLKRFIERYGDRRPVHR